MYNTHLVKVCSLTDIDINLERVQKDKIDITLYARKHHKRRWHNMDGRKHRVLLFVPHCLALAPRGKEVSIALG
jgi:hypothetical protein